jgi:hypothetical protein
MSLKSTFRFAVCLGATATLLGGLAAAVEAAPRKKLGAVVAVTGFAAMHDLRREGNRLCFSDHWHYGTSTGQNSIKAAQAAAVGSWADFVVFEYDTTWANFKKASEKDVKCSQGSTGWGCDVSARPCR